MKMNRFLSPFLYVLIASLLLLNCSSEEPDPVMEEEEEEEYVITDPFYADIDNDITVNVGDFRQDYAIW